MHYPVPITREDNPPDPMPDPRLRMVLCCPQSQALTRRAWTHGRAVKPVCAVLSVYDVPRLRMVRSMVTMSKTMARGGEAASLLAFDTDCQPIPTVNKS